MIMTTTTKTMIRPTSNNTHSPAHSVPSARCFIVCKKVLFVYR